MPTITTREVPYQLLVTVPTKFASVSRVQETLVDGVHDPKRDIYLEAKAVEATGPWSLNGILSTVQAAALADKEALATEVAAVKKTRDELLAERDAARAERDALKAAEAANAAALKAVNDELRDIKNPTTLVRYGVLRKAINALDLAKRWETAVDATVAALTTAKDSDPKRIDVWWASDAPVPINTAGPDWADRQGNEVARWRERSSAEGEDRRDQSYCGG